MCAVGWLLNDLLWYVESDVDRIVVPASEQQKLLRMFHEQGVAGHVGGEALGRIMKERFYWKGMIAQARSVASECAWCQKHKAVLAGRTGPMEHKVVSRINEVMSIDLWGPLDAVGDSEPRYALTHIDVASSFAGFHPLTSIDSKAVIEALEQWCSVHGYPRSMLSDRGQPFMSDDVLSWAERRGIRTRRTTAGTAVE